MKVANKPVAAKAMFTERKLHLDQLRFTEEHNARPEGANEDEAAGEDDEAGASGGMPMSMLIATIEAVGGLILPLIVVDLKKKGKGDLPLYGVVAGARRLRALLTLRKEGRLSELVIPCREVEKVNPMLISLIENTARVPMHAADECVAFGKLIAKGQSLEGIAASFSVDVRHVQRSLALAKLHPKLLDLFRQRKLGAGAAKALTTEPDQARQLAVWNKMPAYNRGNEHVLRRMLTEQDMGSGDRLVRFVGLEAYKAAGGEVREDLFATEKSGDAFILSDPGLVETIAAAKLQDKVEGMLAQGWSWAEAVDAVHSHDVSSIARERGVQRAEARGADRSKGGYFVYCDQSGHMQIDGPYMAKKDAKAQEKARTGGKAGEGEGEGTAKTPDSLMSSLTAHKSAALQCALLGSPRVALALLASNIMADLDRFHLEVRFDNQSHRIESLARGFEQTKAAQILAEADKVWEGRIPEDVEPLAWFLSQPEAVSLEAIVWGAARSFQIINSREGTPDGVEQLQKALSFSLPAYFKTTADTYLSQIPKAQIIETVVEACGKEAAAPMESLKKGELVIAAEARLSSTEWVPAVIR